MTLKIRILQFLTTFTQLTARLKNFLRGWLLVLGLKEGLVECATVCVKSEVILEHYCEAKMNFTVNYEKAILSHSHLPPVLLHSLLQKDIYPSMLFFFTCKYYTCTNITKRGLHWPSFKLSITVTVHQRTTLGWEPHFYLQKSVIPTVILPEVVIRIS